MNRQELMDSLTQEQRRGIALIIRSADIEGNYSWDGEASVWVEDTSQTLNSLADYFDDYDPTSALEQL